MTNREWTHIVKNNAREIIEASQAGDGATIQEHLSDGWYNLPEERQNELADEAERLFFPELYSDEDETEDDVEDTQEDLELGYVETLPVHEYAF